MQAVGLIPILRSKARIRLRAAGAALLAFFLMLAGVAGSARALRLAGEYEVKAAFLVNFGGFVHWPSASFADAQSPFVICIIGDDPFGAAFGPFKKNKVAGRPLVVQSITSPAAAPQKCQILFIAGPERPRLPEILRDLKQTAVLTVSDIDDFAVDGGMIQLFTREQKIRFVINRASAEAAGLKIDARLLKLGETANGSAVEERR